MKGLDRSKSKHIPAAVALSSLYSVATSSNGVPIRSSSRASFLREGFSHYRYGGLVSCYRLVTVTVATTMVVIVGHVRGYGGR